MKKKVFNVVFLLLVFGLTIYSVFEGEDIKEVVKTIMTVNPWYLILGVAGVIFFIAGESVIIHYLLGTLQIKSNRRTCFLYSSVGFFFSAVTPSASGGQPMQVYYMNKNKIPIPIATIVLMVVTITYKAVLVIIGVFVAVFQRGFVHKYLEGILPVFYLGVVLNVIFCTGLGILIFHPALAKTIVFAALNFMEKIHLLKHNPVRTEKITNSMKQYNETADYLKSHKRVIFQVLLISFVQRFALFFVTWFVYKALGLKGAHVYDVVMLQAIVSVSVDMLPLPGGMGVSENLFLVIFKSIFVAGMLLPGMVLSRGISYYVQLFLSAVMTLCAQLTIGQKITKKEKVLSRGE